MTEEDATTNTHTTESNTTSNLDSIAKPTPGGGAIPIPGGPWNQPKSYSAITDGFAICVISVPGDPSDGGCIGWAFGQTPGLRVYATAGSVEVAGPLFLECPANLFSTFILPVRAGQTYSLGYQNGNGTCYDQDVSFAFYWMPFGTGSQSGTETFKRLSSPQNELDIPPYPSSARRERRVKDEPRQEFVAILEELLGKKISAEEKEKLLSVLRQF